MMVCSERIDWAAFVVQSRLLLHIGTRTSWMPNQDSSDSTSCRPSARLEEFATSLPRLLSKTNTSTYRQISIRRFRDGGMHV